MSFDLEKQVDWNQIYNDENLYKITEKKWKNVKLKFNNYYEPEIKPLKNLSIINPETNEENFRTETTAVLIRKEINNTNFETVTKKVYQERKNKEIYERIDLYKKLFWSSFGYNIYNCGVNLFTAKERYGKFGFPNETFEGKEFDCNISWLLRLLNDCVIYFGDVKDGSKRMKKILKTYNNILEKTQHLENSQLVIYNSDNLMTEKSNNLLKDVQKLLEDISLLFEDLKKGINSSNEIVNFNDFELCVKSDRYIIGDESYDYKTLICENPIETLEMSIQKYKMAVENVILNYDELIKSLINLNFDSKDKKISC